MHVQVFRRDEMIMSEKFEEMNGAKGIQFWFCFITVEIVD